MGLLRRALGGALRRVLTSRVLYKLHEMYAFSVPRRLSTSLSDDEAYPQVCAQAASDARFFREFRRNPIYNEVLEHVSEEQGLYLTCNEITPESFRSHRADDLARRIDGARIEPEEPLTHPRNRIVVWGA